MFNDGVTPLVTTREILEKAADVLAAEGNYQDEDTLRRAYSILTLMLQKAIHTCNKEVVSLFGYTLHSGKKT